MSKKYVYTCDLCEEPVTEEKIAQSYYQTQGKSINTTTREAGSVHICRGCADIVKRSLV